MIIKPDEHVCIVGRNGCGKTYLAEKYLAGYPNVIVLDTKGLIKWEQSPNAKVFTTLYELINEAKEGHYIYKPIWEELNEPYYNRFFEYCYRRQNTIVWVDEVMSVCQNASTIPEYYKAILTRGRQLNVVAWSLTQRPATIPLVCMSEASHVFTFTLNMEKDRQRMAEICEDSRLLYKPDIAAKNQYAFWYTNLKKNETTLAELKP